MRGLRLFTQQQGADVSFLVPVEAWTFLLHVSAGSVLMCMRDSV